AILGPACSCRHSPGITLTSLRYDPILRLPPSRRWLDWRCLRACPWRGESIPLKIMGQGKGRSDGPILEEATGATGTPAQETGILVRVRAALEAAPEHRRRTGRPLVTLSYAQSLDGSIAARPGRPLTLSGPQSMVLTHGLRSFHDAILVGI